MVIRRLHALAAHERPEGRLKQEQVLAEDGALVAFELRSFPEN
jgi:hypothetical protein